ncbi:AAA family ATPase [Corynebacterium phoceense]|uniref:AAA family ATPase n=1 Tax=Corynebacterium phoceense TaxID=1686286 RepID=UPI0034CF13EB
MRDFYVDAYAAVDGGHGPEWVSSVPGFVALRRQGLDLRAPVTVLTGDNGVGKSTLAEGIAFEYGFPERGGIWGVQRSAGPINPLRGWASLRLGNAAKDGYFLRAETHYNVGSTVMSHGESVMDVVQRSFDGRGLYILDEPESGLSLVRQMTLMAEIHRAAEAGAQFIVVTHSPIVAAIPGARIVEITEDGFFLEMRDVTQTLAFQSLAEVMRRV